jgi:hypothetical protein
VTADSEGWRTFTPVPPRVERGHRDVEVDTEIAGAEQLVQLIHVGIVDPGMVAMTLIG